MQIVHTDTSTLWVTLRVFPKVILSQYTLRNSMRSMPSINGVIGASSTDISPKLTSISPDLAWLSVRLFAIAIHIYKHTYTYMYNHAHVRSCPHIHISYVLHELLMHSFILISE